MRLAENNQVSLEEAKKLLDKNELKEFKWTLDEYIQYGQENAIDQRWLRELENASAKFHISKLNAELLEIRAEYEKAFAKENEVVEDTIKESYTDRYDHMAFEIQKGYGVGFKVAGVDSEQLDKVIKKPWASDGKNFSDRIWTKKEQMVDTLHGELIRSMLTGGNTKDAIKIMQRYVSKDVKNAKYAAARLIRTESSYFASEGQKECFKDLDVEKYEIVATLDNRTSDICQGMDGQVFDMKDFETGVTAPPFHVNCRSTTAPYFDDEFAKGERAARDNAGTTYYVPSDMTFKEWKKMVSKDFEYNADELKYYKPVIRDKEDTKTIAKNANSVVSCEKLVGTKNNIYIDKNLNIKRRELDFIDNNVEKAMQVMGINNASNLPTFAIVSDNIDNSSLASFNAIENTIFIKISMGNRKKLIKLQEGLACSDNPLSTPIHELYHWEDAEEYSKKHGKITKENYKDYDEYVNKNAKKKLDKLEKKGYNITNISPYALDSIRKCKFDEVYAEHYVNELLKG